MSLNLNAMTLNLGDKTVTLRLTTRAIRNYAQKHGEKGANPLVAVLSAVDDLDAKIELFSAALTHPGNDNPVKDGADLLDLMADNCMGHKEISRTIVDLAVAAGLVDSEQGTNLAEAVDTNNDQFVAILTGVLTGKPAPGAAEENPQKENPT